MFPIQKVSSFMLANFSDKWKELELKKMSVGGNQKAREFFEEEEEGNKDCSRLLLLNI